ncbi:MAG: glycosyltransferase [Candidatus Aminicenantes bacterium]|nr:glycosyltransferase [Candidatus Aminicenantes bacterium]
MKLIIQIPCYNEAKYLPITLKDLPQKINGIDQIETLVIDDGSKDRTAEVARENGVDHIIRFRKHRGLAAAFSAGLESSLLYGADIVVNTDADNQYRGQDIPKLVDPILKGQADLVIGDRQTQDIEHFSWFKKKLQKWGSSVVKVLSRTDVPDAPSGFRAMSKEAALRINVLSDFSYTLETLIQAGNSGLSVESVPVKTNEKIRDSRLFTNLFHFLKRSGSTILRSYTMYKPLKIFSILAVIFFVLGLIPGIRFLYFVYIGDYQGHVQSLILTAILLIASFLLAVMAVLSDLIASNRKLIEEVLRRVRRMESENNTNDKKTH